MKIEDLRVRAMNACISIANDYTKEEVEKFMPPSVQMAWEIGNSFLEHEVKEAKKRRKHIVI